MKFKVWLLNLKDINSIDGTALGEYMNNTFPGNMSNFEFYKVFDNDPEHHMFYSAKYLNETSVFKLLWKHYGWQSFFRYMKVNKEW